MISSRLRWSALLACALLAVFVAGSSAAADDSTSPTASVAFTPSSAPPGASVTIAVTVTPGTNPDSTGLAVTCDLSWAGLGSSAPLDPDASGLIFSRTLTVSNDAVPGDRIGTCTVTDDEFRLGSADYSFTISSETNSPPTVDANGPYTVVEGGSVVLAATGSDPESGVLTYEWDLDNDGTYETTGVAPTFAAGGLDGPSSQTIRVRVTDEGGLSATDTATVNITNTPPTATFSVPSTAFAGFPVTLALASPHDPSDADTTEGFAYGFDCGDGKGYGAFSASSTTSCPTGDVGTLNVRAQIRDQDGDVTEYRGSVEVTVTFDSLCDLVRSYSSDPKVADDLCAKLATAEAASNDNAKTGALGAFANQAAAKVDKGLTAAQAAELELLSRRL